MPEMRTRTKMKNVASDCARRENVPWHILFSKVNRNPPGSHNENQGTSGGILYLQNLISSHVWQEHSGSLGQGLSVAVGMALAAKMQGKDYRTYCLCGDGEIQEGQIWEAAMFAGHRKLDNLCVIVDNNNLQIDGTVEDVCSPYPIDEKFKAFNFHVININGNDFDEIDRAFAEAKSHKGEPTAIIAHTIKGKGVSFMEDKAGWHGKAPNEEEYKIAMEELEKEAAAL